MCYIKAVNRREGCDEGGEKMVEERGYSGHSERTKDIDNMKTERQEMH